MKNFNIKVVLTALTLLSLIANISFAQTDKEEDFYTQTIKFAVTKNLKKDYGVKGSFAEDISLALQKAINEVSSKGGGKLIIPKGEYTFSEIQLKSNVHIEVDKGTIIRPPKEINKKKKGYKSFVVFRLSSATAEPIENVSIVGKGGKFIVDMTQVANRFNRVFIIQNIKNFKLENIKVEDNYSKFASFVFNGFEYSNKLYNPQNGLVKNIEIYNADYGYGLIQMQVGEDILFKNLYGLGGTTLRLETHNKTMHNSANFNPLNNIVARNVISEKGNSAVQISPHFVDNGIFNISNVTAIGSGWAVRIGNAFANKEEKKLGLKPGSFNSESVITNIKATYAESSAQLKPKHYRYMPCDLRTLISKEPINPHFHGESYHGPSMGVVLIGATNYTINIAEKDVVESNGFRDEQIVVRAKDAVINCPE